MSPYRRTLDDAALKEVPTGRFFSAGANAKHFAQCKGNTVQQVHGIAPLVVNFVGPDESQPEEK